MKIAIGADHNGYDLKEAVKEHVEALGHEVEDFGCHNVQKQTIQMWQLKLVKAYNKGKRLVVY